LIILLDFGTLYGQALPVDFENPFLRILPCRDGVLAHAQGGDAVVFQADIQ